MARQFQRQDAVQPGPEGQGPVEGGGRSWVAVRPLPMVFEVGGGARRGPGGTLVICAAAVGDVNEARVAGLVDLVLVVMVTAAYVLCRGWSPWRTGVAAQAAGRPDADPAA